VPSNAAPSEHGNNLSRRGQTTVRGPTTELASSDVGVRDHVESLIVSMLYACRSTQEDEQEEATTATLTARFCCHRQVRHREKPTGTTDVDSVGYGFEPEEAVRV
jgi:hypothetical protein